LTLEQQLRPPVHLEQDPDPLARQSAELAGSLDNLWREALRVQMKEIDLALDRIHDGSFGLCEQCDQPISTKRLEVIPWARKCFPCQSAAPDQRAMLARYAVATGSRWYSSS
jgi:DnaK suppressor protein